MEKNNFPNTKNIFHIIAVGFKLFRAFDIVKPWPISYLDQNLKNGLGVFLDDLIAGLLSFLVFFCFYYLLN